MKILLRVKELTFRNSGDLHPKILLISFLQNIFYRSVWWNHFSDLSHFNNFPIFCQGFQSTDSQNRIPPRLCRALLTSTATSADSSSQEKMQSLIQTMEMIWSWPYILKVKNLEEKLRKGRRQKFTTRICKSWNLWWNGTFA